MGSASPFDFDITTRVTVDAYYIKKSLEPPSAYSAGPVAVEGIRHLKWEGASRVWSTDLVGAPSQPTYEMPSTWHSVRR